MAVNIGVGSRKRARGRAHVHFNIQRPEMYKVVFLGDSNVGKTCLAKMLVDKRVLEQSTATIGFDYHTLETELEDGVIVTLQVWDTAGMEKFRNAPALVPQYYHNTDGIVLVFDITVRESFDRLDSWISEMKQYSTRRSRVEKINMILIGNKLDLNKERKVTKKAAQAFADSHNMVAYVELSAKENSHLQRLEDSFSELAKKMISSREEAERTQAAATKSQSTITSSSPASRHPQPEAKSSSTSGPTIKFRSSIEKEFSSTGSTASRGRRRVPIEREFSSTGSIGKDWIVLSGSEENIPDYVCSAQEKGRLESQRCSC